MTSATVVAQHEGRGRRFTAAGVGSFMLDEGDGDAVVCMHGVPASCFLYRKVVPELAERGLRGIAFDLPGLGLAERPAEFDYSWTGLGAWATAAVDALALERFHLVVHDIGGPIGFEVAAALPERVASLTVLNTMIDAGSFRKPWVMRPFGVRGVQKAWLHSTPKPMFRMLLRMQGIQDRAAISTEELDAYHDLLLGADRGAAFLQIMRGFDTTSEKTALYTSVLRDVPYPVQLIWGEHDPALRIGHHGEIAQRTTGVNAIHRLPGRHFLQEDNAPAIAEHVANLAATAPGR